MNKVWRFPIFSTKDYFFSQIRITWRSVVDGGAKIKGMRPSFLKKSEKTQFLCNLLF